MILTALAKLLHFYLSFSIKRFLFHLCTYNTSCHLKSNKYSQINKFFVEKDSLEPDPGIFI